MTTHSLQVLASSFSDCRQSRPYRRSPVPVPLRQQAVKMLEQYNATEIIEAIGITRTMLCNWKHDAMAEPVPDTNFISLASPDPDVTPFPENMALTLTLNQEQTLRLEGNLSSTQLTALMAGIVSGMGDAR